MGKHMGGWSAGGGFLSYPILPWLQFAKRLMPIKCNVFKMHISPPRRPAHFLKEPHLFIWPKVDGFCTSTKRVSARALSEVKVAA